MNGDDVGLYVGNTVLAYERARRSKSSHAERQSRSSAYVDLKSTVISLPVESQSGFGCTMSIVVVRMQVLASGRDRFVPQVVTHVSQVAVVQIASNESVRVWGLPI